MPGESGLALLEDARRNGVRVPIVVITGNGTVDEAVQAMRAGAYDFLQKPVDTEQLALVLGRAVEHHGLVDELQRLRATVRDLRPSGALAGQSQAMQNVRRLTAQVAPTEATVLVTGESGTGKELVARELHALGARAEGPLVLVNCAAIPENLFESEFFGHRRGAFSGAIDDRRGRFAEAASGTLVLDEIGTLQADMQAKLLRVLETGEFQVVGESATRRADARIVAVTNDDLASRVRTGGFREDLYYRLAVFPIEVPPLREHLEDLPAIAAQLLARGAQAPASAPALAPEVLAVLASYAWPGNVRELRNVLERARILAGPERAPDAQLVRTILESTMPAAAPSEDPSLHLRTRLDAEEKRLVNAALVRARGRKKDAAGLLGIDPRNLGYYLKKHGLQGGAADGQEPDEGRA